MRAEFEQLTISVEVATVDEAADVIRHAEEAGFTVSYTRGAHRIVVLTTEGRHAPAGPTLAVLVKLLATLGLTD